jgi:hypothetical protein
MANRRIYKYALDDKTGTGQLTQVKMDPTAPILHFGVDPDAQLCLWAAVDPNVLLETRTFVLLWTGQEIDQPLRHIATAVRGLLVWHLFEVL